MLQLVWIVKTYYPLEICIETKVSILIFQNSPITREIRQQLSHVFFEDRAQNCLDLSILWIELKSTVAQHSE